ncbi:MAG: M14 family metallopeptidase [Candidatus Bathyarchaeia archaeon]
MLKRLSLFLTVVVVFSFPVSEAIEAASIRASGWVKYDTLTYARPQIPSSVGSAWRSKDQRINLWKELWNANGLSDRIIKIGSSVQGKDVLMFDCGNASNNVMLIDAELHGNEDHPGEVLLMFVYWLLESGDSEAQRILQGNRLLFVPSVDIDRFGRVNARPGGGVNLNRNFVKGWGQSGDNTPGSSEYRGPSAGSEPETQTMRKVFSDYQPRIYVNFHVGAFMARGYGNSTQGNAILGKAASFKSFFGATAGSGSGSGGFAVADAVDLSGGCCAWLIEFFGGSDSDPKGNGWEHTSWHLDQLENAYYPAIKEFIIESCLLIEGS